MEFINYYNISELLINKPDFEYAFITVKRHRKKSTISKIKTAIKKLFAELIRGKNHYKIDAKRLNHKMKKLMKTINFDKYPNYLVERVNDEESEKLMNQLEPDIILQSGAGILKENIFKIAKIATINVHHGYAPEVRGIQSTFWALYYGLTDLIGVTCHCIDKTLDTGDVILQYKHEYRNGETFVDIQYELIKKGAEILVKSIDLLQNKYKPDEYEVTSYYFGKVDVREYNRLKKNRYIAVGNIEKLKSKRKKKVVYKLIE